MERILLLVVGITLGIINGIIIYKIASFIGSGVYSFFRAFLAGQRNEC